MMSKALSNKIYYTTFVLAIFVIALHASYVDLLDVNLPGHDPRDRGIRGSFFLRHIGVLAFLQIHVARLSEDAIKQGVFHGHSLFYMEHHRVFDHAGHLSSDAGKGDRDDVPVRFDRYLDVQ